MTVIFILKPCNNYWLEVQLMLHHSFLETMTVSNSTIWKLPELVFGCKKRRKRRNYMKEQIHTLYIILYFKFVFL